MGAFPVTPSLCAGMGKKEGSRAEYNEEERRRDRGAAVMRRNFLLGFHNRKQQRKVDYLTKKLLSEKREHAMERIAVFASWVLYCRDGGIC